MTVLASTSSVLKAQETEQEIVVIPKPEVYCLGKVM